ncbi:hypothetical protein EMIHUDRAFT_229889 [Emiliania huxleyi CCMP1516]|uniref:Uncharacterized protein n=2 Tax=Emiliania huxleyi TaxID=2903 RepID=A0A0D3KC44_EMIH1|nr:hypothetical protein EMIHUDRAFT_229889 [Emiliania huxleyi CCMP1516]EOD33329.1 hypothetical protein EMIHUDRAFT_229889 [Emiliania huxleyi CCMP1516]|eukprot:XP_005785758.1 hypothetical protein EMIHUDRAFT_229889 [Emiliania huxleyi CCMP1516]
MGQKPACVRIALLCHLLASFEAVVGLLAAFFSINGEIGDVASATAGSKVAAPTGRVAAAG